MPEGTRFPQVKRFSQNNEQDIIIAHFGAANGIFLDMGANDGERLSNSRALALMGWSGVCVEPSPQAFQRLRSLYKDRPDIECHNVGMCEGNGPAILHESGEHLGNGDIALLSTANSKEMERWTSTGAKFTPTEMECVMFAELLKRSEYAHFDFITMDIEGLDYEVLSQIDLRAVGCRMLIVEFNGKEEYRYIQYCREYGMHLRHKNAENLIFIR